MINRKYLKPRLAEIGKIKIGKRGDLVTSAKGVKFRKPVKFDHFVITTTQRKAKGDNFIIDTELMKKLDSKMKPREISIRLMYDKIDLNFHTSFQSYQNKKCFCKGDGVSAERRKSDGTYKKGDCNPDNCKIFKQDKCKISGILSCMITANPEFGGVYRFRTHGWNSVSNILASLEFIAKNTKGVLQNLPLRLKMITKTSIVEISGKDCEINTNVVTIVLDGIELNKMRTLAIEEVQNRNRLGTNMKMIEDQAIDNGFLDDTDDPEDVQDEFFPDIVVDDVEIEPEPEKKAVNPADLKEKIKVQQQEPEAEIEDVKEEIHNELDIF